MNRCSKGVDVCNNSLQRILLPRAAAAATAAVVDGAATASAVVAGGGLLGEHRECGLPLRNELSTLAPAQISATKVVTGWMLSKAPVDGCAPLITISIDSSSEGLS